MIWQIAAATGWSVRHIMWTVNYQTLRMMLADAPRYVSTGGKADAGDKKGDKPRSVAGFFQTRLNKNE